MRWSMRIGISALALGAAALVVGACAGARQGGGSEAGGSAVRAAVPAPATSPSLGAAETGAEGAQSLVPQGTSRTHAAGSTGSASAPSVAALAGSVQERVIQTAAVSLTVGKGRFEGAFNRARAIATGLGGFVASSSTSQTTGSRLVRGELVLRVPADAYAQAIDALSRLGRVQSQQETGKDVSQQYVDLRARQRHLEAVEAQLLTFLKRARTVSEALAVQSRLDDVQLALEEVRGELRYLDGATAYSTITVDIAERGAPAAPATKPSGGWSLADAWGAAASGFRTVVGGLLVALVVAGPLLALLALLVLGGRALLRRRTARAAAGGPAATPSG